MRRIIAQARKEITQVLRDRLTLTLALLLPLILLALMGTAISLSVKDLPIVVQDLDNTPESRKYIEAFRASLTFRIVELSTDEQPEQALMENRARGALIIPSNFGRDIERGANTEIQFLIDASDANTGNIMRGAATAITQNFVKNLRPNLKLPIKADIRLWFNPGRESSKYIAPSMLAVGLSLFPPLLGALAMSREGEQKTILQVYVSSISAREYLLGKIGAYWLIAVGEWILSMLVTFFWFGLSLRGDPSPLIISTAIYLFCTVTFGVMVGAAIPNQAAAIQAVQIAGFLLSYLLSGAIFPVQNIPFPLNIISHIIPARYYIEVVRDALVRGGGWAGVWHVPLVLAAIGLFFFMVAWRKMRKMQVSA